MIALLRCLRASGGVLGLGLAAGHGGLGNEALEESEDVAEVGVAVGEHREGVGAGLTHHGAVVEPWLESQQSVEVVPAAWVGHISEEINVACIIGRGLLEVVVEAIGTRSEHGVLISQEVGQAGTVLLEGVGQSAAWMEEAWLREGRLSEYEGQKS